MKSIGRPHPHPHLRRFPIPISAPNPIPGNAQPTLQSSLRMKILTPDRISLLPAINSYNRRFRDPRLFSVGVDSLMASAAKDNELMAADSKKEETKELPAPPEKPEPGDCCGSGCVRCVWDVYYEELEDYEKLCKTIIDSDDAPKSKST